MSLRLIKTRLPEERRDELIEATAEVEVLDFSEEVTSNGLVSFEFLTDVEATEPLVEALEGQFGTLDEFRLVILAVEATVPQQEIEEEPEAPEEAAKEEDDQQEGPPISIEELYADVTAGIGIDGTYVAMILLSTLVTAVGLTRDDVAVVIAGMIIAPLLNPNMSLSLATTLADDELGVRALRVNSVGLGLALFVSVVFGYFIPFDPEGVQIALRTRLGLLEILLAASAGGAGALSFTTGETGRVVGVMVAVALLPPLVVFGMLLGTGMFERALGALYLVVANLVCLNLAGVVTFFAQRIRPRTAWESERAKRATRWAVLIWAGLLAALVAVIVFGGGYRRFP